MEAEARMREADGQYRWMQFRAVPQRDEAGKLVKWYGKSTDIEDRKRADQERERVRQLETDLAHINRVTMMGELSASIAHEVNQPLTGIVSNAGAAMRWLDADTPDVEEVREAIRDIARDGKRAGEVIARIRALTKRTSAPAEKLDLNETIREVLAIVGDQARKNSIAVRTEFADELAPVSGDRVQLQQVLLNLIMNAMDAMKAVSERPRQLVITTRNIDPGQVQVTVEDSGIGLDASAISRIFDAFYTTKLTGMGMGLSISRSIVQNHGGRIWATANDGAGTSFHFTLPQYQEQHAGSGTV
jgi:signal transduction histidine kinase